jgi:hypothetical protein
VGLRKFPRREGSDNGQFAGEGGARADFGQGAGVSSRPRVTVAPRSWWWRVMARASGLLSL